MRHTVVISFTPMKAIFKPQVFETLSAVGMVVGLNLLVVGFLLGNVSTLSVPALLVLAPSLLHGMR